MKSVKKVSTEPVAVGAILNGAVSATLALLAAFHVWTPTPDQVAAVLGFTTALEAVVAIAVRRKVTPVAGGDA